MAKAATNTDPRSDNPSELDQRENPQGPPCLTWRDCDLLELPHRVKLEEQAVKDGYSCLRALARTLESNISKNTSCRKWLQKIKAIRDSVQECQVLIGFIGVSGAGKSSLINTLLEHDDLLPADDEKACTAVCVEISWNSNTDPESSYLATVERINAEDWRTELESLFQDLKRQDEQNEKDERYEEGEKHAENQKSCEHKKGAGGENERDNVDSFGESDNEAFEDEDCEKVCDGDDDELDPERDARIKATFHKVKCVYPHIEAVDDLTNYTVSQLMDDSNVKDILGQKQTISEHSQGRFAEQIKPFINSNNTTSGETAFAQWPLVKLVRLRIRAAVLRDGVVLVDLPGTMDSNVARGAIAEKYQENLAITCIITPTQRAASDKPAQDLLGKVAQRSLQLDGRFSGDDLCFVVSKTDSSISVPRYIKTHPNVRESLAPEFAAQNKLQIIMKLLKERLKELHGENKEETKTLKAIQKDLKQLEKSNKSHLQESKKRKRLTDEEGLNPNALVTSNKLTDEEELNNRKIRELKQRIRATQGRIIMLHAAENKANYNVKKSEALIELSKSRQKAACIRNRNELSAAELKKDFNAVANTLPSDNRRPLQVFCVSAHAFSEFKKTPDVVPGFPTPRDTGIPSLVRWFTERTLAPRHRSAVSFLEDIEGLELSMALWIKTCAESTMSASQKEAVEDAFSRCFKKLLQNLSQAQIDVIKICKNIVEGKLFSAMASNETYAATKALKTVPAWAQPPMHWATYRAVNRRRGLYTSCNGVTHKWNEELAANYLDPLIVQWYRSINMKLPQQRIIYNFMVAKSIEGFVKSVTASILNIYPELSDDICDWQKSVERIPPQIQRYSRPIFTKTIKKSSRQAHRMVTPKISEIWSPIYDQCAVEHGSGHFKRIRNMHQEHIEQSAYSMYQDCSQEIRNVFEELWQLLPGEFGKGTEQETERITDEFHTMIEKHTIKEEQTGDENIIETQKLPLQQEILSTFSRLKTAWCNPPEIQTESQDTEDQGDDNIATQETDFDYLLDLEENDSASSTDDELDRPEHYPN